jgi:tRNA(Leu) C34 or U34 (ribose-2'-O)-methylase TrmL
MNGHHSMVECIAIPMKNGKSVNLSNTLYVEEREPSFFSALVS